MNCPVCNVPMRTRIVTTYMVIDGRRWVYEYDVMICDEHPNQQWQTSEQLAANINAINSAKAAADKLKKQTV